MTSDVRYGAGPDSADQMDSDDLRETFLLEGRCVPGEIRFTYTHIDRMIVGGAIPADAPLAFGDGALVGTPRFFDAREMGIANLGGLGWAEVDGARHALANRDIPCVGRDTGEVRLGSDEAASPARFYMNSVPAGADHPMRLIPRAEAEVVEMGEPARSDVRRIAMYVHPEVAPSAPLLMGITDLARDSIWNTMPPHLHERRMETYCDFDLAEGDRGMHFVGRPDATRHMVMANGDVVLSPAWSIHMGAGTGPYAFVRGMTGENRAYADVDPVAIAGLR